MGPRINLVVVPFIACLALGAFGACRERRSLPPPSVEREAGGPDPLPTHGGESWSTSGASGQAADAAGGMSGYRASDPEPHASGPRPPLVVCEREEAPATCQVSGSSRHGLRLIGTLLEPTATRARGVVDLDAQGYIRCASCDCGDAGEALVIDCPDLVLSPGFVNLHDHLSYAGTPPLAHPGELYEHRSEWRLGENGHAALSFQGGASTAQILAHELRHVMGGATSIVGAGARAGLLRNLDVAGHSLGLLAGTVVAETFPLDDARGALDSAECSFGEHPDTDAVTAASSAYVAHLGEGTSQRAEDELRCALGELGLLGSSSAVVHAMALTRASVDALSRTGASVVWSPRSNLDLYGSTAPVALLASRGVRIALGTDWLASGSMNLQRELACAREYDQAVLGGYFDAYQRFRMVTENAAWALGVERRLAALAPGLVGDLAVFTARGDPYESAVGASPVDVRLVLRQGAPLYGDAELVAAFSDGAACEELVVCGAARRVCTVETGLSLAELRTAGEAVYPLFSCAPPPDEPRCVALKPRECAQDEETCTPPPPLGAWDGTDVDADGVPDVLDGCPRSADPDQTDSDADGSGDACDFCPVANPGLTPCPRSIAELRAPPTRLASGAAVALSQARVTALRRQGAKGFYVEDGNGAPYSGIFVYTKNLPSVLLGDLVDLQGYFRTFEGTDELVEATVLTRRPAEDTYGPLLVSASEVGDTGREPDAFASLFVRVQDVSVHATNPDLPKDYDETLLQDELRLDDLLWPDLDNTYAVGTQLANVQGIAGYSFGHRKLFPRAAEDVGAP